MLQGFHGAFSHRGSNEYAVDFDCPVATPVLAARPGIVVAANAAAQGSGTTPDFLEYRRTNFVLVLHDDGTLGEYMHLAPSGVRVSVGQRVERGDELALSGNTGFSSTPHLHFQVMTAGERRRVGAVVPVPARGVRETHRDAGARPRISRAGNSRAAAIAAIISRCGRRWSSCSGALVTAARSRAHAAQRALDAPVFTIRPQGALAAFTGETRRRRRRAGVPSPKPRATA